MTNQQTKAKGHNSKHYWFNDSIKKENVESNYWFLSEIGSNLMCFYRQHFYRTFHCMEKSTERVYYIKVIIKIVMNPRKKRELLKFLTLTHPNLVKVHEIYETDEAIFVVTDPYYMNILDNFIEKKTYSEREVAEMIKSILRAVAYLHNQKIFHRCINPENIVCIMENGQLIYKLDNCYIGSIVMDEVHASLVSSNLSFTAPELLRSTKVDFSADMWSIGLVAYFLLSGSIPFFDHSSKGTLNKLFTAKLRYEDIHNITFTLKDFLEHLVTLDTSKRMTAEEALSHPWIFENLNSMKPLVGLCEGLEKYKKSRMVKNKVDIVNSSTYDDILTKHREAMKEYISSPISCVEPLMRPKTARPVIVTAETDFYFRFGSLANKKPITYDYDASNICRVMREMYKTPDVTLYEEAVRCQTHYSSVFLFNEYIPSLWKLLHIPIVADYEEWRNKILAALLAKKQAREAREEKERAMLLAAELQQEEEEGEEEEEEEDEYGKQDVSDISENSDQSGGTLQGDGPLNRSSKSSSKESDLFRQMDENEEESLVYSMWPSHLKDSHFAEKLRLGDTDERDNLAIPPFFSEKDLEEEIRLEDLYINKRLSEYEPDIQMIGELLVAKPKKKYQKRKSVFDFMLMVGHPEYFQPLYNTHHVTEAEVKEIIQTRRHLYQLYRYRPPFHPTQLGVDQFTVEQEGLPGDYVPIMEDFDPDHVNDQRYILCRGGISVKREIPPWLMDVDNPVPYLIPVTQFNSIIKKGIPVPDSCKHTPPPPLPLQEFTVYSFLEDPMWSRFNSFPNFPPPEIQNAVHYIPFNENARHYRDFHCPKECKLAKKCPYKEMIAQRMDLIKRTLRNVDFSSKRSLQLLRRLTATTMNVDQLDEERLKKAVKNEIKSDENVEKKSTTEDDGGEKCQTVLGWSNILEVEEAAMTTTEELDDDCIHLTGRPCLLDMFDATGKFCALSKRGNTRLCCQNLYSIWRKMDRDEAKASASTSAPFEADLIPHYDLEKLEAKNNLAKRNLSVGQLVVNLTENPDRYSRFKNAGALTVDALIAKEDEEEEEEEDGGNVMLEMNRPRTIENELQRQLKLLKELKWMKGDPNRCHNANWTTFIYPDEKNQPVVWSFEVMM